jgi:plasmid maintenance system antidote protein VapI
MMALRFEKAFGISADTMLRMQVAYDLAQVRLSGKEPDVERVAQAA